MINRYLGNSGTVQRLPSPETPAPRQAPPPKKPPSPPAVGHMQRQPAGVSGREKPGGLLKSLASGFDLSRLETEDIILLLILCLLYRESGDEDLLVMMGALFFL